jgi:hypothetical protein
MNHIGSDKIAIGGFKTGSKVILKVLFDKKISGNPIKSPSPPGKI